MLEKYISSKQKTQKKKSYGLCLGNISKDFTINNMKKKKKTRTKRSCKIFSVDFNPIDTKNILEIHRYLKKRT